MGLTVELVTAYSSGEFGVELPARAAVSRAFSFGARYLTRQGAPFEFLPPKIAPWQQLAARYSSSRLRMAGATAGAVALLVIGSVFDSTMAAHPVAVALGGDVAESGENSMACNNRSGSIARGLTGRSPA